MSRTQILKKRKNHERLSPFGLIPPIHTPTAGSGDEHARCRLVLLPGDPSVDPGFSLRTGHDQPVVDRASLSSAGFPAEDFVVEICYSVRLFCWDLEMDKTAHAVHKGKMG